MSGGRSRRAAAAALACAALLGGCSVGDNDPESRPPQLGARGEDEDAAAKLGFPASATKNTLRVGGGDAAADAAGVASAVFPATDEQSRPTAVVLVDSDDWQAGVSAAVLAGRPIGAPLLLTNGSELPEVTRDTLDRLKPKGSDLSKDAQVIRIGKDTARPEGLKTAVIQGKDPYERAAAIDRFASTARGKPSPNVVVVSGEQAEWAMPAAAWAARSGDAVLLTKRDTVPPATLRALRQHEKPDIYVLGPESVISKKAVRQLDRVGPVRRIAGPTPVQNAIAFSRYARENDQGDISFGWNVRAPGYNVTLASTTRPLDAAASAALGTNGVFAPLLLTNRADTLPKPLEFNLQPLQPGFEDDPRNAVYTRYWILGDDKAISLKIQSRLDRLAELVPVQANAP